MYIFNIFVLVVSASLKNVIGERQLIRVGNIKYECGADGQITRRESNTTKLRLPANCLAMYSVNTERTTFCTNQQRCTLMTWKIIRQLEMFLNTHYKSTGPHGIVQFKNELIIPDFNYLLHVILKNFKGQITERDFNVTFSRETKNETKKILGHLDLHIGSLFVYPSLPVIVNANVTLCGNVSYYYFKWSIVISKQEIILHRKRSQLIVPPQILQNYENKSFLISCLVINAEDNGTLLEESVKINIIGLPEALGNKINVYLPFKYTTINKGAPIYISPFTTSEDYKIQWSCMLENTWLYGCQGQINKEFYMDTGFSNPGHYSVTLKVTKDKFENSATCSILIKTGVPSIELNTEYPITPEKGIKIIARIYELRTYCLVHWDSEEETNLDLNNIPGLHKEIYNISSKDKTFLEEIEEYGNITVTKEFKLIIPPPSRKWQGLNTNLYKLKIIATCPPFTEINDMHIIEEKPHQFVTISAETEFHVPPLPEVKSLEVYSDENIALISNFIYKVEKSDHNKHPLLYKYGFVLENLDVIFYSGIDTFYAKTLMPYNGENGVETFIEVCDYQKRCGKTFGPIIKTRKYYDLDKHLILKTFKQLLIEEDFYKAFLHGFIILHSVNGSKQIKEYETQFSAQISKKIKSLMNNEDIESKKTAINDFLENIVLFAQYLALSQEVMKQMLLLTKELSKNTISHYPSRIPRKVSRHLLSITEDNVATLEEIKHYLFASEYVLLNSFNTESMNKEKDHMLNLLDGWMVLACNLIFREQRVLKIEMKTMVFSIEKISKTIPDRYIPIPFDNNKSNETAHIKIKNVNDFSDNNLCIGTTMLRDFFNRKGIIFGANIYSAEEQLMDIRITAQIRVFIPIDPEISKSKQLKCTVYKNGFNFPCSVVKQYTNFIECLCPAFGYYFIQYSELLTPVENRTGMVFQNISYYNSNKTENYKIGNNITGNVQLGQKISYVVIVSSLMGFVILCYIIRKLSIMPQQNIGVNGGPDNAIYGQVMHDELLE